MAECLPAFFLIDVPAGHLLAGCGMCGCGQDPREERPHALLLCVGGWPWCMCQKNADPALPTCTLTQRDVTCCCIARNVEVWKHSVIVSSYCFHRAPPSPRLSVT